MWKREKLMNCHAFNCLTVHLSISCHSLGCIFNCLTVLQRLTISCMLSCHIYDPRQDAIWLDYGLDMSLLWIVGKHTVNFFCTFHLTSAWVYWPSILLCYWNIVASFSLWHNHVFVLNLPPFFKLIMHLPGGSSQRIWSSSAMPAILAMGKAAKSHIPSQ